MKGVQFGNEGLMELVGALGGIRAGEVEVNEERCNLLEYYEPKFRDVIKKVNNTTIEIDLVKSLVQGLAETTKAS